MPYNPNTIWISHTSLGDFEKCKKLYWLRNLYRDQKYGNNFRVQIASPYLSLGEAVHNAIDNFVTRYTPEERDKDKLMYEYSRDWASKIGKRGGFKDTGQEKYFKERGEAMLERFWKNSYFNRGKTIPVNFPKIALIGQDDAILVGNFDWLEETQEGLHILDFKTGANEEEDGSLQLPIYALLAEKFLKKPVAKVSYWYLDKDDQPIEKPIPDLNQTLETLTSKATLVKQTVDGKDFVCLKGENCVRDCIEYSKLKDGEGEHVGTDYKRKREIYYLTN